MLLNYSLAKTSSSIIYYKYFNIVVWLCFLNWFLLNLARKTLGILFYAIQKSYKGSTRSYRLWKWLQFYAGRYFASSIVRLVCLVNISREFDFFSLKILFIEGKKKPNKKYLILDRS